MRTGLLAALLLSPGLASAQGNMSHQEKGDVLFRDLNIPAIGFVNVHNGIFWEYTGDDPDDTTNLQEIEMLGTPSNRIIDESVFLFKEASTYRGAYEHPENLSREERKLIVDQMRSMELRTSPSVIGYVDHPTFEYLDWTDRNSNGQLDFDDIDNMRSDAAVEFAYAKKLFPILKPLGWTIITQPNKFRAWAALTIVGGLSPRYQQNHMVPATVVNPSLTIYDANGNTLAPGAASSMTVVTADVFDEFSGPGGFQVWLGGSLVASNYTAVDATFKNYTSADSGLSGMASLADGQYTIVAIDQAGNHTSQNAPIQTVSTGTPQLMIPARDLECLRRIHMDVSAYRELRKRSDFFSPHLFCLQGISAEARTFARHPGVPPDTLEDPFTGSATGGMAAFLWRYGLIDTPKFIAEQGHWMGRPGRATVEVLGPRENIETVKVGGQAVTILHGEIEI